MKPAHLFSIIVQMLVLGAGLSSAQAAAPSGSLIVNGSFEDPVIAGSFQLFSSIPGWQPTGSCGNIEIDRNAFGVAADGKQSIELNTTCVNGVSQVIATTPGATYSLAFAFAARPGTTAAQNQMEIRFDGLIVDNLGPRAPGAGLQWSVHQYEVTATGSSTTLSFQGSDPTTTHSVGTELDFVSLVPLVLRADPLTKIPESLFLLNVVCPSPSVCIVLGFDPTFSDTTVNVITDGIPGPTQVIPDAALEGLTCASPTSCFALGTSNDVGALVPITNGVVGPLQAVPGTFTLRDAACTSATSCVATGLYYNDGFPPVNDEITAVVLPITDGIAGPPQSVAGAGVLSHVSCPSATSCFATGRTGNATDNQGVLVPITNGVAGPAQVVAGTDYLVGIACPSPSRCVAVGGSPSFTGNPIDGFVVAITDGTAGPAQFISPDVVLGSIACTDASHCVAVGWAGSEGAVVAIDDGVAGSYQVVPGTGLLSSVACSTSCVAVGSDNSFEFGAIVPISGGVPGSAQYADGAGSLWELVCGAGGCMVVGGDPSFSAGGFLAIRPAARPTISTLASPSVPAGGLISDSATLTGGFAPTGNVTFTLYGPGDGTCSNALWSTTVPVGAGGVSHSGDVEVGAAGTYNWVATYSGDLANLPVSSECGSEPVVITPQTLSGRAYGLSANVSLLGLPLINRPPTPDTGEIATTLNSSTSVPCVATLSGPLSAHALCASVTTTAFPGGSTAVASVADLSLSVATLPTITIGAVHSASTTSCDGSTGATTIAYLKIGSTVVIATPTLVAPNTHVTVGPVSLVLNEQVPGPTGGLTVNGIHLSVNGGGLAQTNLIVGSARSGIGNCP
ncbi:MAG TPA: choice-of-anchor P family protein [Thermoanaerobaculia bacterium]|nr:choice-of-anchor P family protein [Thermoanaerobaculia bacterium]